MIINLKYKTGKEQRGAAILLVKLIVYKIVCTYIQIQHQNSFIS